jgi:hypothetical protein
MRLLLFLVACFPSFDPASHVQGLRVLGVKAEPPEVAPGETATLTPLVFDSRGGNVTIRWSLCLQAPLPGQSVDKGCFDTDLGAALTTPLGEGPTMQVTMPNVSAAQLGIPDSTGGVYLPVILEVNDGVETVTSVYRLRYSVPQLSFFRNHNPHIDDILIAFDHDAGTKPLGNFEIHTGDRVNLRALLPDADHELYPQIEGQLEIPDLAGGIGDGGIAFFDGGIQLGGLTVHEVPETLRVSWFTNIGRLDPDVTGAAGKLDTTLYLDKFLVPPPADIDLYVVVRDDRGGTDFTQRTLLLR